MTRMLAVILIALRASAAVAAAPAEPDPSKVWTLPEAIERALVNNSDVRVAAAEIRRAEGLLEQARSGWLPTLTGNGSFTRIDAARTIGGQVVVPRDVTAANLSLAVPLLAPQQWVDSSHAADTREIAQLSVSDVRRQVALAVARAYLAVLAQKRILAQNINAHDAARAHAEFAGKRLDAGAGSRLDSVRAAQEVAADQTLVEETRTSIVRAQEALGVLLGLDAPADVAGPPEFPEAGTIEDILQNLPGRRADLKVLDDRVRAAAHVKRDDWTDYMPYASGLAEELYQRPATPFAPEHSWQLEFVVTIPFYDGGRRYGLAVEHDAELTQARENLALGIRHAHADARIAFEAADHARAADESAREASRLAHEALDITNLSYRAGAITNIEVTDAQRRAHDADIALAQAEDSLAQAKVDLLSAAGLFP